MPINYHEAIDDLCEECAAVTESKGFLDNDFNDVAQTFIKTALIGTEVSEAIAVHRASYDDSEEDRITHMTSLQEEDFTDEIADVVIRSFDLAGYLDLDLGRAIISKIEKNKSRPARHGKRY